MSLSIKFCLLALIGAAAAVPHYGAHSKFHHRPSGSYAGPTGGWSGHNSTITDPSGTGVAPGPGDESTTETTTTHTSKATLTQTIYVTPVPANEAPTSVAAVDVGLSTGPSACGPATVTVTATNKVTVTVSAGGAKTSAHVPVPEAPTSVDDATVPSYAPVEPNKPSTSVVKETEPTKEAPAKEGPTKDAPVEHATSSTVVATSEHSSASPSSKPTSSPPTGGKRGLAYLENAPGAAKGLASMGNFGWASNWEADPRGDIGNVEFIPTLRSIDRAPEWPAKIDTAVAAGSKVVFTFNEPDIGEQSNMSPQVACDNWNLHVKPLMAKHPNVNFIAPSITSSENDNMGLKWLTQFQDRCSDWSVANFHWYGSAQDGFTTFKAYIEKAYATIG